MAGSPASSVRGGFPLGLAGATAATRYVGATATGAPASGTFAVGDFVVDQTGKIFVCSVAGTPGTWVQAGGSGGVTYYLSKPADGITITSTALASFSTPWTIPNVVVAAGQSVRLTLNASPLRSANNDYILAIFRGSTQVATGYLGNFGAVIASVPFNLHWIDTTPGAATYTYEVKAAIATAGTITIRQTNPTTFASYGGTSIFTAEVYTP